MVRNAGFTCSGMLASHEPESPLHPGGAYRRVTAAVAELLTAVVDLFDFSRPSESLRNTDLNDGASEEED